MRRATLLAAALLLAACGARLDEDQIAASGDGPQGDVRSGPATPGAPRSGSTTSTTAGAGTPGAPVPGQPGGPQPPGGEPGSPGQPGSPCAPDGASDVGISPDSITLGQVGTISGPVPGLSQTAVNGVRAYFAYRNSQGGVCGRELQLINGDDRLDTGQNRAEHSRMLERVFGFVGGWSVVDDGGASVLEGTNVPDVGLAITDRRIAYENNFSTNPIPSDQSGALSVLTHLIQTYQPASAAVVWPAQATARNRALAYVRDLEALGVPVPVQREVAVTESNYVPAAQEIENAGAELVVTALEMTGIARLSQALRQVGYQPPVPFWGAQAYGERLIELAGDAVNGTILGITHSIIEEGGGGGSLDAFVEWYRRVNPDAEIDFFAFQGWVAADMFATAIESAGPAPTRDAVLAVLRTYTSFDAHGLIAPINPAQKQATTCFMLVTIENQEWRRLYPEGGGFACP
jgi:ABC-type branched-subunit amino acid transport system substrate-binding protein